MKVVAHTSGWMQFATAYVCSGIYIKSVNIEFTYLSQDFSPAPICIYNLLLIQPSEMLDPSRKFAKVLNGNAFSNFPEALDFDWRFRRSLGMHHRASCTPM